MKPYFNFSLLLFFALWTCQVKAQQAQVKAHLDKSSMAIGDQVTLSVVVSLPPKGQVAFPLLKDSLSSKILLVGQGKTDTVPDQAQPGNRLITQRYILTSFEPGLQQIPSLQLQTGTEKLNTEALSLQVNGVKVDTTKAIYDIKQPLTVSYTFIDWLKDHWAWILIPVLGILLVAGVWYYLKKRKGNKIKPELKEPEIPAHELALNKLSALKAQKLWQQDRAKEYHTELTDILREYLEKRYQVNAMEQTSEEIFLELRHVEMPGQSRSMLLQLFKLADLVKFAKEKPLSAENERSMENSLNFIVQTRPEGPLNEHKEGKKDHE
ncbi:BatD family protein [Pedobacter nutrimenti]|uniref:Oxygen tolerance protein BatD n=1 Tax=Pedobacter nutrimenti TaxID=1241337 RepID=A0A318UB18_9SPHI|nr:BatD family protein [Pedobacter nutrimenti]PYF68987.1 hypothetical protein B0O44_111165 [Pedobacter nutrimenti]